MLTNPWFRVSAAHTTETSVCYQCYFILNPKHSIVSAAKEKTKSFLAKARTVCLIAHISEACGIVQRRNQDEKEDVFRSICCKAMTDLEWQKGQALGTWPISLAFWGVRAQKGIWMTCLNLRVPPRWPSLSRTKPSFFPVVKHWDQNTLGRNKPQTQVTKTVIKSGKMLYSPEDSKYIYLRIY